VGDDSSQTPVSTRIKKHVNGNCFLPQGSDTNCYLKAFRRRISHPESLKVAAFLKSSGAFGAKSLSLALA
jgi:hypothetical protein